MLPPPLIDVAKTSQKHKLYSDDGTEQLLGHNDGLWALMRLSVCFVRVRTPSE